MEKMIFFEASDLVFLNNNDEFFVSLDVVDITNRFDFNIFENKPIKLSKFPNTLEEIGKKFSCEKKIGKFLLDKTNSYEFTYKIKLEKKGIFESSVSIRT